MAIINFNGWIPFVLGDAASVFWNVTEGGSAVIQELNGLPTVFCSDFETTFTAIQGNVRVVTHRDDDYWGMALGLGDGEFNSPLAKYLLMDMKKTDQYKSEGCEQALAERGLALSLVTGVPHKQELWGHENFGCTDVTSGVQELQRGFTLGEKAREQFKDYNIRVEQTDANLKIYVDGVLEFDVEIPDGVSDMSNKFCFYNFSQRKVRYSGFSVEDISPTSVPTDIPTEVPTAVPTGMPTHVPTSMPTHLPTDAPTTKKAPKMIPPSGKMASGKMSSGGKMAASMGKKKPTPKPTSMGKKNKRRALL